MTTALTGATVQASDGTIWRIIASANSPEDLRTTTPIIDTIDKGVVFRTYIHTPWYLPIAPFFDSFLGEWVASAFWNVGGQITDVWGEGLNTIVIEAVSDPIHVALLLGIIATIIISIGIAISLIVVSIRVSGGAIDTMAMLTPLLIMGLLFAVMQMVVPPVVEEQLQVRAEERKQLKGGT